MKSQQPDCTLAHLFLRLDLKPASRVATEQPKGLIESFPVEVPVAVKTAQRRRALDSASPPGDDVRIPVSYRAT